MLVAIKQDFGLRGAGPRIQAITGVIKNYIKAKKWVMYEAKMSNVEVVNAHVMKCNE